MWRFNLKSIYSIDGKMSEKGSDMAGVVVAGGIALFLLLAGIALIMYAGK